MYMVENEVLKNSYTFFHSPSSTAENMFFYLECAGYFLFGFDKNTEIKNYKGFLLIYVKKGKGKVYYENKNYEVKENQLILLDCSKPSNYESKDCEGYWIQFDGNTSKQFFELLYKENGCVFELNKSSIIPKYLNYIIEDMAENHKVNEPMISCYIQRILTELILVSEEYSKNEHNNTSPVEEAVAYIEKNFQDKISIEKVSLHVNLSPFYFSRIFKKETGYSPYEYIIMTRLQQSKKLLKETLLSIKEIAFSSGFNSESNFVSCFKNNNYVTPKEFRIML